MLLIPTASQTAGPFLHLGFSTPGVTANMATPQTKGEHLRIIFRVEDGDRRPIQDAMLEVWQADALGNYFDNHAGIESKNHFRGFGRAATEQDGTCEFQTIKPGRVPDPNGNAQAPHLNVSIFARGLLKRLTTRVYFADDPANPEDFILNLVPHERRGTLMARRQTSSPGLWTFELRLGSENETVFFDV
jgi:protocatechuate 3,4-dioxygenase alpha subunit